MNVLTNMYETEMGEETMKNLSDEIYQLVDIDEYVFSEKIRRQIDNIVCNKCDEYVEQIIFAYDRTDLGSGIETLNHCYSTFVSFYEKHIEETYDTVKEVPELFTYTVESITLQLKNFDLITRYCFKRPDFSKIVNDTKKNKELLDQIFEQVNETRTMANNCRGELQLAKKEAVVTSNSLKELKKDADILGQAVAEVNQNVGMIDQSVKKVKKNKSKIYQEIITIISIFSGIILTFAGVFSFSTSVIESIHLANFYKLIVISSLICICAFTLFGVMFYFLYNVRHDYPLEDETDSDADPKNTKQWKRTIRTHRLSLLLPIIIGDIVLAIIIIMTLCNYPDQLSQNDSKNSTPVVDVNISQDSSNTNQNNSFTESTDATDVSTLEPTDTVVNNPTE